MPVYPSVVLFSRNVDKCSWCLCSYIVSGMSIEAHIIAAGGAAVGSSSRQASASAGDGGGRQACIGRGQWRQASSSAGDSGGRLAASVVGRLTKPKLLVTQSL
jgi:hypothetical protein